MTGKAYTDDDHRRMDEVVAQHLDKTKITWSPSPSTPELASVLQGVVNSDDRLNPTYRQLLAAVELVRKSSFPNSMLADAWKTGSYRDVRALAHLQPMPSEWFTGWVPRMIEGSKLGALREGLIAPYRGLAVDAFHAYLEYNNAEFHVSKKQMYYGKFCTVVQSSGTGKTRLLLQLATKGVCVLYMNIRCPVDTLSYPPRDNTPADLLNGCYCDNRGDYRIRCYAFFAAVFKVLRTFMEKGLDWYEDMCTIGSPVRAAFFEDLERECMYIEHDIRTSSFLRTIMDKYYQEMVSTKGFPQANENEPRVVIALDEAHTLHTETGLQPFSPIAVLLEIQRYSIRKDHPVWVVFASTQANIGEPPSPEALSHSARVPVEGQLLFTPFTQLGWDQNAPRLGDVRPDEVGKAGHIIQYGRPLWGSLRSPGYTLYDVEKLARQKLCAKAVFDPDQRQAFAVLAQRFCLDIAFGHPGALSYVETLVESHLRVYIKITEDRIWSFSTYPSEPILSCAAAFLLHMKDSSELDMTLNLLDRMVVKRVVDNGQIGELVSRFLWLFAKDFFVRTKVDAPSRNVMSPFEEALQDCQLIPVVDFLEFVFGPKLWEAPPQAKGEFQNAYVNFSHWVSTGFNLNQSRGGLEGLPIETRTLFHWERTSAVQCSQDHSLIDQVIPMYFKPQKDGDRAGMSQIFISDQARTGTQPASLAEIERDDWRIAPGYRGLPYIAISVDLGAEESAFDVRLDRSKDRATCLRIHASGLNATTFAFLGGRDRLTSVLTRLYARRYRPLPDERQALEDQMRFGRSSEVRYLNLKRRDEGEGE